MFPLHEKLDDQTREALSAYDDFTAALLVRRGITTQKEAEAFLAPSYDEHIHDPMLMLDMSKAAKRLAAAISSKEKIAVWSDYDCDGIPGGVVLHDFLKKANADFTNYIPHRHNEGYGVNIPGIEKLAKEGYTLVITVDSGITDSEAVARANELGMEVIVTDHHLPSNEGLPPAFAILNPNARPEETYPYLGLCGGGVAWKLVCATLAVGFVGREEIPAGWEKWLLDMAGLSTIADMVPLTGENRVIAAYGLKVMRKSPRLGFQKLCKVARVNQAKITEDDVGFMIAPRVNAASRMGDPLDAFTLFTTTDESEADLLAKKLESINRSRRASGAAITRAVHDRLFDRKMAGEVPSVIAMGDPDWRPGLLGLAANSIAEEYGRPVFLWGKEGNDTIKGSCRGGPGKVHVVELMQAAGSTFLEFGGHAASGGYSVAPDAVFDFEERLVAALATLPAQKDIDEVRADMHLTPEAATGTLLRSLEQFAPFGMKNTKPSFAMHDVRIERVAWFGKSEEHLRLSIGRGHEEFPETPIEAIAFFAKRELGRACEGLEAGMRRSILAHLERDTFSKGQPIRLRLISIR
ncbi:MAG: single-stranded-DNA-specific exonuclease RecJ [Parcubacteria bacterium C7867-004]|nr:MAG: single-stranded-DNA-specific exonuclease RecJ [Parcubacteria bacterium C7867-004]